MNRTGQNRNVNQEIFWGVILLVAVVIVWIGFTKPSVAPDDEISLPENVICTDKIVGDYSLRVTTNNLGYVTHISICLSEDWLQSRESGRIFPSIDDWENIAAVVVNDYITNHPEVVVTSLSQRHYHNLVSIILIHQLSSVIENQSEQAAVE